MGKKIFVIAIIFVVVVGGLFAYTVKVVFPAPKNCSICHYMTPFYESWKTSSHNMVGCLKCHDYSPIRAMSGQFLFLAGAYNPRPLTNVPDKNCLQSGCHDKRLVESVETFTQMGILFNHKQHFEEARRGMRLHCTSCHSEIVQGEHLRVARNACFLCHFKGLPHDEAFSGCPSCHSAPKNIIQVNGKTFSHEKAFQAGLTCKKCHISVISGDGIAPKDKCHLCHVERSDMYKDVSLVHDKHVTQKRIGCKWCHSNIEHGIIEMAAQIPFLE